MRRRTLMITTLASLFLLGAGGEAAATAAGDAKTTADEAATAIQLALAQFRILGAHGKSAVDVLVMIGGNRDTVSSRNWKWMSDTTQSLYKAAAQGSAFTVGIYGPIAKAVKYSKPFFGEEVDDALRPMRAKNLKAGFDKLNRKVKKRVPGKSCDLGAALLDTIDLMAARNPNAFHLVFFLADCAHAPGADSKYAAGGAPWDLPAEVKKKLKYFRYHILALGLSPQCDLGMVEQIFDADKVQTEVIDPRQIIDKLAVELRRAPAIFLEQKAGKEWNEGQIRLRLSGEHGTDKLRLPLGEEKTFNFLLGNDLPHFEVDATITSLTSDPAGITVVGFPQGQTMRVPISGDNKGMSEPFAVTLKNEMGEGGILRTEHTPAVSLVAEVKVAPVLGQGFKELGISFAPRQDSAVEPLNIAFQAGAMPIWLPVGILIAGVLGVFIAGLITRKSFPQGVGVEIYEKDGSMIVDAELHEYDLGLFKRAGFVLGDQGDLVAGKDNYLEVLADGKAAPWMARPLQENMTLNGQAFTSWAKLKVGDEILSKQDGVRIVFTAIGEL